MAALAGRFSADFPRHSCQQLFTLAADIESYPQFIPGCRRTRVLCREPAGWEVDNLFGAGPVEVHFRSRAVMSEPQRLEITAADGPFRSFRLLWLFSERPTGGCRAAAEYSMAFRSPMLQGLARFGAGEMERRVIEAFRRRVGTLYGV